MYSHFVAAFSKLAARPPHKKYDVRDTYDLELDFVPSHVQKALVDDVSHRLMKKSPMYTAQAVEGAWGPGGRTFYDLDVRRDVSKDPKYHAELDRDRAEDSRGLTASGALTGLLGGGVGSLALGATGVGLPLAAALGGGLLGGFGGRALGHARSNRMTRWGEDSIMQSDAERALDAAMRTGKYDPK